MTTLVTGATGFVGGRIAKVLAVSGHAVKLASRTPESHSDKTFAKLPAPDAPDEAFDKLMADVDHVVHCAALNNDARGATDEEFRLANAVLTRKLVEAASRANRGRFIYLSSSHAVRDGAAEGGTKRPSTAYAQSKGEGELAVLDRFLHCSDRHAAILRLPPVYGVGMRNRLAQVFKIARLPIPFPVTGLERRHATVSCDAVADAVLHLVYRSRSLQPVYVATDANAISVPEIIGAFREGLGRRKLLYRVPGSYMLARFKGDRSSQVEQTGMQNLSLLASEGWKPEEHTLERLRELAKVCAL